MGWIPPKTDWKSTDFFNIEDYNRIVGNLYYVQELANDLFKKFDLQDMEKEKQYYSMFYASEMNAIEENLEIINNNTFSFDIGDSTTYSPNEATPTWEEFNRIETATSKIYQTILSQISSMQRLSFTLGRKTIGNRL